jgi:hypothetical protein
MLVDSKNLCKYRDTSGMRSSNVGIHGNTVGNACAEAESTGRDRDERRRRRPEAESTGDGEAEDREP